MLTKFSDPTGLVRRSILAIVKEVNERELGWKEASRGLFDQRRYPNAARGLHRRRAEGRSLRLRRK